MNPFKIQISEVKPPLLDNSHIPIFFTTETMNQRKEKILARMSEFGLSSVIIYADKEHGGNFEYLTGFIPRFEEALFLLNIDGTATAMLGNENFNKAGYSLTACDAILCPLFSLPNQPMNDFKSIDEYVSQLNIDTSKKVGLVDWKLLANDYHDHHQLFAMPAYIVNSLSDRIGRENLVNATQLFIHPDNGARTTNNANEIAHYEYGASLAADAVLDAMNHLKEGINELSIGDKLQRDGQYPNVVTIAAFGPRFENANIYPRNNSLKKGDTVALTVSFKGGLSSRSGYAVHNEVELKEFAGDYLNTMVKTYFQAYVYWLSNLEIGKNGGEFYDEFSTVYPQSTYGWQLNPGHLTADEEWLSSPFYKNSNSTVKSGMIFAVDFIPHVPGYSGVSAESTVAVADKQLQQTIQEEYPDMWKRITQRRKYIQDVLGIHLNDTLLPLSNILGYYRPFMLDSTKALTVKSN